MKISFAVVVNGNMVNKIEIEYEVKKYLRHLVFRDCNAFDLENFVNSKEFENKELITINTYVNEDEEVIHELWYWFIA